MILPLSVESKRVCCCVSMCTYTYVHVYLGPAAWEAISTLISHRSVSLPSEECVQQYRTFKTNGDRDAPGDRSGDDRQDR